MKQIQFLLSMALLAVNSLAWADPPATVGRLSFLSGAVSFASVDTNNDWGVAPLNRPVTTGDRLWADGDGRAEVRIGPNAIRAAAMTSVDVLRLDDSVTHLRLAQGTLNIRLRQLDAGESFEISTPAGAVLLSRPGSYRVTVDAAGIIATLSTHQGEADVLTGNTPITVRDNQVVSFSAQGQESYAAPTPDEFDHWAFNRDRAEERVLATRYVPPAMTGYEDLDQHGTWHAAPDYGNVWIPAAVSAGWAPYRDGRWVWVSPWGWTWVDNAPWGFAPYHYGRWVWWGNRWAWAPGPRVVRPVYAPALVAFVGGANWSVSIGSSPAVAWVPLGWREPYIPWYRHSPTYVRNVNITHVTNINVINHYQKTTHVRYVNHDVHNATTVVTRDTFVRARHVREGHLNLPAHALANTRFIREAPVARPERQSVVVAPSTIRLPRAVEAREVLTMREPQTSTRWPANDASASKGNSERSDAHEERPRVRVLPAHDFNAPRRTLDSNTAATAPREPIQATRTETAAPAAQVQSARAAQQEQAQARRAREQAQQQDQQTNAMQQEQQRRMREQTAQQQEQQVRAAQQEQQRQTREQAVRQQQQQEHQRRTREQALQVQQAEQQRLQAQKEQHHHEQIQRAREVQLQRERQYQQAQQLEQQRHQQHEQRQHERAQQRQAQTAQSGQAPPPHQVRARRADGEPTHPHR